MVSVGSQYLPHEGEQDPCPNGAAYWLCVSGICCLVSTAIIFSNLYMCWTIRGCGEIHLNFSYFCSVAMFLVQCVMTIWGSVVVFGAWASWTTDLDAYKANMDELNYCKYTPMVFAFTLLLLQWILMPVLTVLCCCALYCAFGK